jgi:hypothetical protein
MQENTRKMVCVTAPCGGLNDSIRLRPAEGLIRLEQYTEQCPGSLKIVFDTYERRLRGFCERRRSF